MRTSQPVLARLTAAGSLPSEGDEERLRRATLVLASSLVSVLALVWVVTYALHGLWLPAAIPLSYQVAAIAGLLVFVRRGHWRLFRTSQLALMLALPFALQWTLGGFEASSAVSLWALVTPFGALMFVGARDAVPWFAGYLALLGLSVALDGAGAVHGSDALPDATRLAFFGLNIAGVSVTAFVLLEYFVRARDRAHALLAAEQERSERLLLNVLPASVADRLKVSGAAIADRHADVSVLFADLVGFTPVAGRLTPAEVVEVLGEVFSAFDDLVERYGVEKIKTLGDGYMVAAGAPTPRQDHPAVVADLALEMRAALAALPAARRLSLSVRIGIDSGPVVAGVLGTRKFSYDLWGDTVNTASRMESHAPDGTIQVSERVHARLGARYSMERCDGVEIKGKGPTTTYLLLGPRE